MVETEAINYEFLETCSKITKEYDELKGIRTGDSKILHIITEVAEFKDAIRNKDEKYGKEGSEEYYNHLIEEYADIFLTAITAGDFFGISHATLNEALEKKIEILKKRISDEKQALKKL